MSLLYPIKALNSLNKAYCYKVIFFTFLVLTLVSISKAEPITGSPAELINGSGSFTWTSQNFPALRDGDTIKINVTSNTIKSGDLIYTMNSYPITDLFSEVFPADANYDNLRSDMGGIRSAYLMKVVNFLFNRYLLSSSGDNKLYIILIDKNNYKLHDSDKLMLENTLSITQSGFDIEGSKQAIIDVVIPGCSGGRSIIQQSKVLLAATCRYSGNSEPELFVYSKNIANNEDELEGIIQVLFNKNYVILSDSNKYGKLKITKNWLTDASKNLIELTNYEDVLLSGNTISIADNFNIVINSNSLYPSANVDSSLKVVFVPYPSPTPTTPIQTPMPTITSSSTPTSTPTVSPSITFVPTVTQITTPAPTPKYQLEQEVKELKERLNKTEEKQSQKERSWLESVVNSIIGWLKSIF